MKTTTTALPRLHRGLTSHVLAWSDGYVLKGGLGAMGVGRMWIKTDTSGLNQTDLADVPYIEPDAPNGPKGSLWVRPESPRIF